MRLQVMSVPTFQAPIETSTNAMVQLEMGQLVAWGARRRCAQCTHHPNGTHETLSAGADGQEDARPLAWGQYVSGCPWHGAET
jgi:hypothetical protein